MGVGGTSSCSSEYHRFVGITPSCQEHERFTNRDPTTWLVHRSEYLPDDARVRFRAIADALDHRNKLARLFQSVHPDAIPFGSPLCFQGSPSWTLGSSFTVDIFHAGAGVYRATLDGGRASIAGIPPLPSEIWGLSNFAVTKLSALVWQFGGLPPNVRTFEDALTLARQRF